jgi:hypothetical protein
MTDCRPQDTQENGSYGIHAAANHSAMWLIDNLAEQRIKQAQQRGEFDDLPGVGQPLVLEDDSAIPEELRAAYRLMKNAGYLPPELQLRGEIARVEQLLAMADNRDGRAKYTRRLAYLLMRLNLSRAGSENLQVERAYFDKLVNKIG